MRWPKPLLITILISLPIPQAWPGNKQQLQNEAADLFSANQRQTDIRTNHSKPFALIADVSVANFV